MLYEPGAASEVSASLGGKATGLLAIADAGLTTPPWFVVLPGAVDANGSIQPDRRERIAQACRDLGTDQFAVRSSAQDEDSLDRSFAGQYRTTLDVRGVDAVIEAILSCVAWVDADGVGAYLAATGRSKPSAPPAVIVQQFIQPITAGVVFSREPLTGADEIVVTAAGLAGAPSIGEASSDEYRVTQDDRVVVTHAKRRLLEDAAVRSIADAARRLERQRGVPQDVEWIHGLDGRLWILQSRPITALQSDIAQQDRVHVWDNANIVESFPDLTLPLTFSVAVGVYAIVYRGACRALGVPQRIIDQEASVFDEMLGLLNGRVYYDLTSWYRVLGMLPGFRLTAGFMESMMGAARPAAGTFGHPGTGTPAAARSREIAAMTLRLARRLLHSGSDTARFRDRIDDLLERNRDAPEFDAPAADLLDTFERFRASALRDWRAPIMNDLFLMLAHGALRRVADRWLGREARALANVALIQGSVSSAMPGRDLLRIAAAIRERPGWSDAVRTTPPEALKLRLQSDPALDSLDRLLAAYLASWGDRAPRELQLERSSFHDDPVPLLRSIRSLVVAPPKGAATVDARSRRRINRRLLAHPTGPLRFAVFWILVRATRRHIRRREEMRLARGRVFAVGRRILRRLGEVLAEQGIIERADDVHYLTLDELHGVTSGGEPVGDPRVLVRRRRASYVDHATRPRLPTRLETRGPLTDPLDWDVPAATPAAGLESTIWHGIGAAHGRARGTCLVVHDPAAVTLIPGRIIVARSTDPGWVPLLVGAGGLLVEQGSLLSHSAIIARELRIPTVVGLTGLLEVVQTGDIVEMDGSTGTVTLQPRIEVAA